MSSKIVTGSNLFVSRFTLKPERKAEFMGIFDALREGAGPLMEAQTNFVFYGWGRNPDEFVAIESWKDEAVVNQLRGTDEFKSAVTALLDCCASSMTMEMFSGADLTRSVFELYPAGPSRVHPSAGPVSVAFL